MNKDEEDIFEDINDEIVSSDEDTLGQNEEEQPQGVPSNSNKGGFVNGLNATRDFQKNNKSTIDRLNDVRNKNQTMPKSSGHIGTDIGNKITGKKEEDKSGAEKLSEDIGGKVAGKGITAATGGLVQGKAAEELGRLGIQMMKEQMKKKYQKYLIAAGILAFIILIFVLIFASNDDDQSESSGDVVNSYISGSMTDEELEDYLKYIDVCTDSGENYEKTDEDEKKTNTADCKYAKKYFRKIKEEYDKINASCTLGVEQQKDIDSPCGIEINVPLLHETLSYNKSNDELWNKRATPNQEKDIEELSGAMVEYVHESCFIMVHTYTDSKGYDHSGPCADCTEHKSKRNKDLYYFQLSFDKYISFLKYGTSSTHPYYQGRQPVLFGENHDHECTGPTNSAFDPGSVSNNSSSNSSANNNTQTENATESSYCSAVYCANYANSTAKEECRKGCENVKTKCANEKCKDLDNYSSSAYISCMNSCVN